MLGGLVGGLGGVEFPERRPSWCCWCGASLPGVVSSVKFALWLCLASV